MLFIRMLLGFSPWIAFALVAPGSLFRLKLGILAAFALALALGLARLCRGIVMWAGLLFFAACIVAVVLFECMWAVRNMHILANGALALAAWTGIALRRPFPLEFAQMREEAPCPPLRAHFLIALLWAAAFSTNTWLAVLRRVQPETPVDGLAAFSRGLQISATLLSIGLPLGLRLLRSTRAAGTD